MLPFRLSGYGILSQTDNNTVVITILPFYKEVGDWRIQKSRGFLTCVKRRLNFALEKYGLNYELLAQLLDQVEGKPRGNPCKGQGTHTISFYLSAESKFNSAFAVCWSKGQTVKLS